MKIPGSKMSNNVSYNVIGQDAGVDPIIPRESGKNAKLAGISFFVFLLILITLHPSQLSEVEIIQKKLSTGTTIETEAPKCLTFEEDVEKRIAEASQVFITMPAKAAGSSLKTFEQKCLDFQYFDNFIIEESYVQKFLSSTMDLPKFIVSHIPDHLAITRLAQTTPKDVLTIFIYREESERKVSSIKQVVEYCFCEDICWPGVNPSDYVEITKDKESGHCIIESETDLIYNVIGEGMWEIGFDTNGILSCPLYDAIDDNDPNMLMINYKEVDKLQEILARHYCPELLDQLPIHVNFSSQKQNEAYVRVQESGEVVPVDEWAKSKQAFWDWAFDPTSDGDKRCQVRTREMERQMFACEEQVVDFTVQSD